MVRAVPPPATPSVPHVGASVVPADVSACPAVPLASRVPVPEAPPYIISPPVVIG